MCRGLCRATEAIAGGPSQSLGAGLREVMGVGFRVMGVGFRVFGYGFRVMGVGFWVMGLGLWV